MIFLAMFLFGFTTLLADMHYGEANLPSSSGEIRQSAVLLIVSSVVSLNAIWALSDLISYLFILLLMKVILLSLYIEVPSVHPDAQQQYLKFCHRNGQPRSIDAEELRQHQQ